MQCRQLFNFIKIQFGNTAYFLVTFSHFDICMKIENIFPIFPGCHSNSFKWPEKKTEKTYRLQNYSIFSESIVWSDAYFA